MAPPASSPKFIGLDFVLPVLLHTVEPNTIAHRTLSGRPVFARSDSQYFTLTLHLKPFPKKDANVAKVFGHLMDHGIHTPFTLDVPQPLGVAYNSAIVVSSSGSQNLAGENTLTVDASSDVSIPKERFFTIAGHSKLYRVREALDVSATPRSLKIYPALTKDVDDNSALNLLTPQLKVVYAQSQSFGVPYTDGGLVTFSLNLEEFID